MYAYMNIYKYCILVVYIQNELQELNCLINLQNQQFENPEDSQSETSRSETGGESL